MWKLTKIGNQVTLTLPAVTGTAAGTNVNFVLGETIPAAYRPSADLGFYCLAVKNNGASSVAPGFALVRSDGIIIIYRDTSGIAVWTTGTSVGLEYPIGVSWTI